MTAFEVKSYAVATLRRKGYESQMLESDSELRGCSSIGRAFDWQSTACKRYSADTPAGTEIREVKRSIVRRHNEAPAWRPGLLGGREAQPSLLCTRPLEQRRNHHHDRCLHHAQYDQDV